MITVTQEEFNKKYGIASQPTPTTSGYGERVMGGVRTDLENRSNRINEAMARDTNPLLKGFQIAGQGAGFAANTLETLAMNVPGVKTALKPLGAGIQWALEPSQDFQKKLANVYETATPDVKDTLDATFNFIRLGGDVAATAQGAKLAVQGAKAVGQGVKNVVEKGVDTGLGGVSNLEGATGNLSPDIMNRVARLKPTDFNKFKQMSGKTPGDYLVETGNFGAPDKIIENEAIKFRQSLDAVDDALAKIPGEYRSGVVRDALNQIIIKGQEVSSPSVKASYLSRAHQLLMKAESLGLNMSEINEVKRLFEGEIKLGFGKLGGSINPTGVQQATNIDNALRSWQFKKAAEMGFENIGAMNKQTQISKFLINKLGSQVVGQAGLNGLSLTDWIMLSGGDPTAVGGLIVKKFLSGKGVQAKIAKMLSGVKSQGFVQPKTFQPAGFLPQGGPQTIKLPGEGILGGIKNIE